MSAVAHGLDRRDAVDMTAVLVMLGLTFSWGLNGVAVKFANVGFNPVLISIARSSIAAVCVFSWCRWRGIVLFARDGTLWAGLLTGALFGLEFVLIFWGLDFTTVARGTLMLNTMPFWVLLGAHFMLGERMSLLKLAGTVLAFCGVALVFSDRLSLPDPEALKGDAMCLAAGIAWAATIIVIKRSKLSSASAEKTLLYQLAVSAVITVPLLGLSGPPIRDPDMLSTTALLFQAVFVVAFTYLLWFWLMRRYPAGGLSSFAFLTPAFGVLLGWLLLDEPLSPRIFAALGLIAIGLVIVNRPARKIPPA